MKPSSMKVLLAGTSIVTFALISACSSDNDASISAKQSNNDLSTFAATDISSANVAVESDGFIQSTEVDAQGASEQVNQFNQVIVSLLHTKREYLRDTEDNHTSLNMLDASLFATDFSLIYQASDEFTRDELEQYWLEATGIAAGNVAALGNQLNNLENLYQPTAPSGIYTHSSNLWVQHDHLFKRSFIDWVYNRSKSILINTVDYVSDSLGVSNIVLTETGIDLVDDALSTDTRLFQTNHHGIDDAAFSQESNELVPAYFRNADGKLRQIEAIKLQGNYQQSQQSEGTITLIPLENTGLQLALIQPVASQYDYLLSVLPAMLRQASGLEPTTVIIHVPIVDSRQGATYLQALLQTNDVSQLFDKKEADLTNLDRGGQYVSYLKHTHQFTLAPMGLTADSNSVVATKINPENPFFNIDPGSVDTFGVFVTISSHSCVELEDFYTFDPMLLVLVDTVTGAITFVVELDRMEGETVPTSACVSFLPS